MQRSLSQLVYFYSVALFIRHLHKLRKFVLRKNQQRCHTRATGQIPAEVSDRVLLLLGFPLGFALGFEVPQTLSQQKM